MPDLDIPHCGLSPSLKTVALSPPIPLSCRALVPPALPCGPCLLAPEIWGCFLLGGSPVKTHLVILLFLLQILNLQVELLLPALFGWMGSSSSFSVCLIAHSQAQYFALLNYVLFSALCQACLGFLLCCQVDWLP